MSLSITFFRNLRSARESTERSFVSLIDVGRSKKKSRKIRKYWCKTALLFHVVFLYRSCSSFSVYPQRHDTMKLCVCVCVCVLCVFLINQHRQSSLTLYNMHGRAAEADRRSSTNSMHLHLVHFHNLHQTCRASFLYFWSHRSIRLAYMYDNSPRLLFLSDNWNLAF